MIPTLARACRACNMPAVCSVPRSPYLRRCARLAQKCNRPSVGRRQMVALAAAAGAAGGQSGKSKKQLWMAAIKPPMYSVGIVPVLAGAAIAVLENGQAPWLRTFALVISSILVIAWLNLSNDGFDAQTGVDKHKAESVVNLTGRPGLVLVLAFVLLILGVAGLAAVILTAADSRSAYMLAIAIACGYVYQGPPFRLSYKGLGEPLCFVAFGPMATPAFYLAQLPAGMAAAAAAGHSLVAIPPSAWALSVVVGITTTVILFCSHWHQIEGDKAAGKMSPLVRIGTARACQVLEVAGALPYAILLGSYFAGWLPLSMFVISLTSLPSLFSLLRFAKTHHRMPVLIAPLKRYGTTWHIAMGACILLGAIASKSLGW